MEVRTMADLPDGGKLPDDTVMVLQIRHRGYREIWTYLGLKKAGRWFFTGRGPHDAGWGAVKRWLAKDGRMVLDWDLYSIDQQGKLISMEGH